MPQGRTKLLLALENCPRGASMDTVTQNVAAIRELSDISFVWNMGP